MIRSGVVGKLGRVRLKGDDLEALRLERFDLDRWRCVDCRRIVRDDVPDWAANKAHLAHMIGRGRGGSDTIANTRTKCGECHFRHEHNPKVVRRKGS